VIREKFSAAVVRTSQLQYRRTFLLQPAPSKKSATSPGRRSCGQIASTRSVAVFPTPSERHAAAADGRCGRSAAGRAPGLRCRRHRQSRKARRRSGEGSVPSTGCHSSAGSASQPSSSLLARLPTDGASLANRVTDQRVASCHHHRVQLPISSKMDEIMWGMAKVFGMLLTPVLLLLCCGVMGSKVADKTKSD
jgi:hypothetical protein